MVSSSLQGGHGASNALEAPMAHFAQVPLTRLVLYTRSSELNVRMRVFSFLMWCVYGHFYLDKGQLKTCKAVSCTMYRMSKALRTGRSQVRRDLRRLEEVGVIFRQGTSIWALEPFSEEPLEDHQIYFFQKEDLSRPPDEPEDLVWRAFAQVWAQRFGAEWTHPSILCRLAQEEGFLAEVLGPGPFSSQVFRFEQALKERAPHSWGMFKLQQKVPTNVPCLYQLTADEDLEET